LKNSLKSYFFAKYLHQEGVENMNKLTKNQIYDKLHRGAVTVCVGVTALGMVWTTYQMGRWYMYRRPYLQEEAKKRKATELAEKQAAAEAELQITRQTLQGANELSTDYIPAPPKGAEVPR